MTTSDARHRAIEARHRVKAGQAALAASQWVDAARHFIAALQHEPRDALAWYGQALALRGLGEGAAADEALQRAVALDATLASRVDVSPVEMPVPSAPSLTVELPDRAPRVARPVADVATAIERLRQQDDWAFAMVRPGRPVRLVTGSEWVASAAPFAASFRESTGIVPILGRTEPETLAAWLGAVMAGRSPTLLSYPSTKIQGAYFAEKIARYRALFDAPVVGTQADQAEVPDLVTVEDLPNVPDASVGPVAAHGPLFVQCSSGTTGLQKAVEVRRDQLEHQVRTYADALGLDANTDRIVSWLPLYHDMGLIATLWLPLLMDVPVVFLDPFEWAARPAMLYEVLASAQGTLAWQPNFAYALAARHPVDVDLSHVRAFVNCAEPISAEVRDRFVHATGVRPDQMVHCYALAENVFAATQTPVGEPARFVAFDAEGLAKGVVRPRPDGRRLASCGRPLPDTEVRIDADPDHVGEVWLRGPSTIPAYLGQEPTRDDGWFETGDLGFLHEGELFVTGRTADRIVHHGRNVQPHDLEAVMNEVPGVHPGRSMAVGVVDDAAGTEQIWGMFEPREDVDYRSADAVSVEVIRMLQERFAVRADVVAVPRRWLRKTSSGKVARRANARRRAEQAARHVHIVGDSHVQVLWRRFREDHYRQVHAHWVGQLWARGWSRVWPLIERVARRVHPTDVLVVTSGEAECRTHFAGPDGTTRLTEAVEGYTALFRRLRHVRPEGPLVYLTGIPTRSAELAEPAPDWPVVGSLETRLARQSAFYAAMRDRCAALDIAFADACTPFQASDGTIPDAWLHDGVHLHPTFRREWVGALTETIGLVDLGPAPAAPRPPFDGTWSDFRDRCRAFVTEHAQGRPFDEERLVSGGTLDSIGVIDFIGFLETQFDLRVDLVHVSRTDFDALSRIWARWLAEPTA